MRTQQTDKQLQTIRQFNHIAIQHKLTGLAMQLWYAIYDTICQHHQDLYIASAQLADTLHTGSRQLLRARTALAEAGCITMRKQHGRIYYTIPLLDDGGNAMSTDSAVAVQNNHTHIPNNPDGATQTHTLRTYRPRMPKAPDIIMNRAYRQMLDTAITQLEIDDILQERRIRHRLEAWCDMRYTYGWTLTAQGLDVSLKNLRIHSGGDAALMEQIISRTLRRKWKGFYPYITDAQPSGDALIRQEAKAQRQSCNNRNRPGRLPAYDTQKLDDFDFLELR